MLRDTELVDTAERFEGAYDRQARIVALEVSAREGILRALEDPRPASRSSALCCSTSTLAGSAKGSSSARP